MTHSGVIITGGTGFLGARLVNHCCRERTVFVIARHAEQAVQINGMNQGPNIHYFNTDVGDFETLREVFHRIQELGGADVLLHLAGFYDFTGDENPEYAHTNVVGTRNVLELAESLRLKKLFFASSIAACPFPPTGKAVTEETPPTAPPPYSRSKRAGEELLREYRDRVPSVILRLAAIFSEWCEYEPLYNFIETWFSNSYDARILGGWGRWAIPYLHVRDLVSFFLTIVERSDELEPLEVLQASPNGCTSQRELFEQATLHQFGRPRRWLYVPKPFARLGIHMRLALGRMTGVLPFERPWMGEYIDQQLNVDATRTHQRLGWRPSPELRVLGTIPTMLYNRASNPAEWRRRYERACKGTHRNRRLMRRPS